LSPPSRGEEPPAFAFSPFFFSFSFSFSPFFLSSTAMMPSVDGLDRGLTLKKASPPSVPSPSEPPEEEDGEEG